MKVILITYLVFYGLFAVGIFAGTFLQRRKEAKRSAASTKKLSLDDLTVLIPFRNEAKRLSPLLQSFNQSTVLPARILFINDDSKDTSVQCITDSLNQPQVRMLTSAGSGKKEALRTGMLHVETPFVLTLDADVSFDSRYFEQLQQLPECDLCVLPVRMVGSGFSTFFELDVHLSNALNTALSAFTHPILCSGANLLYRVSTFNDADRFDRHRHLASGDDQFLLKDFKDRNAHIVLSSDPLLCAQTEAPNTLKELFHQRIRWIAKSLAVNDKSGTIFAAIQGLFTIGFLILILLCAAGRNDTALLLLYLCKTGIDLATFAPYFSRLRRAKTLFLFPLYEFLFPLYSIFILVLSFTYSPRWKGRPIVHEKRDMPSDTSLL